jgi:DNA (cytosine-5)-methyltransferase 1
MRVLDLFCGAGGAGKGYALAGFDVVGVDIEPQPNYPFEFIQADALTIWPDFFSRHFDAVHASPPCQFGTALRHAPGAKKDHPNLIPLTRAMLKAIGLPYIIENVTGSRAHLEKPVMLCGSMFHLGAEVGDRFYQLRRHRYFECSFPLTPPQSCAHFGPCIGVYGGHVRNRSKKFGGRETRDFVDCDKPALAREAMGMSWATMGEMSQAIPPAYTHHIGRQLKDHLDPWRRFADYCDAVPAPDGFDPGNPADSTYRGA